MSAPLEPLALERNLALMAGAGAGKTYSLVTMALHLLAGARAGAEPLPPARLCLVTFTDKAAAELRARLRLRLDALAQGGAQAQDEPELRASLERLGRPFPPPEWWRQVREALGATSVGTFHSLCARLLRRAPPGLGVEPAFEVLDALEARALVHEVCERVVLEALEAAEPAGAAVRELCQELTFAGTGFSEGLVDALATAYAALREEGLRPAQARIGSEPEAREALSALVQECLQRCAEARAEEGGAEWSALCAAAEAALQGMTPEDFLAPARFPALVAALEADPRDVARRSRGAAGRIRALRWRVFGKSDDSVLRLQDAYAAWRTVPFEAAFRALLEQVEARHAAELQQRGVLDFTALLVRARDLLRDHPPLRRAAQERVGALLVDEFQDTNRLQLELVLLLSERREGAPRALAPDAALAQALPLEPALLCAVGDRKQAIYEFRGADVSVFSQLAQKVLAEGGAQHFLQHNRRSTPSLLAFFNGAFSRLMAPRAGAPAFDVAYVPAHDDLAPVRADVGGGPAVERLRVGEGAQAAELRAREAEAVARRLAALLAPDAAPSVTREGAAGLQRARGGDVAVLFRTFTHLELYRQALMRHGVPHRVLRGRGFYGAQEVLELAALLALLADPGDVLAFATVLRSPLVGLCDAGLLRLAGEEGLHPASSRLQRLSELGLAADEQLRLERFLAALPSLRRERDRVGVRALLQAAMSVTGYREALAASPFAEQASANVQKLLALAGRRDARGAGGCVSFARELRRLAEVEPNEAQAELLEEGDPHAVQLLTIHRAKGLEWPVVVVPALGGRRRPLQGRVHVARDGRLALRPWLPDVEGPLRSARHEAVRAELSAREAAEYRRLLYVALTRARDRLILAGAAEPNTSGTWWQLLEGCLAADARLRALVTDVDVALLPEPAPPPRPAVDEAAATAELEVALARVRGPGTPAAARGGSEGCVVPVSALRGCPRCDAGAQAALPAADGAGRAHPPLDEAGVGFVDREAWATPRSVGERARRLLERVDFALALAAPATRAAQLAALVGREGWDPADADVERALEGAARVLASAWAREVGQGPPDSVHRRLPYALPLEVDGEALTLEGQVDLLRETRGGGAELVLYRDVPRPAAGAGAWARELAAAQLAAGALLPAGAPLRVGVLFLQEARPEPEFLALDAAPEVLARGLWAAARAVLAAGPQRAGCQALCGPSDEHCFPSPGA